MATWLLECETHWEIVMGARDLMDKIASAHLATRLPDCPAILLTDCTLSQQPGKPPHLPFTPLPHMETAASQKNLLRELGFKGFNQGLTVPLAASQWRFNRSLKNSKVAIGKIYQEQLCSSIESLSTRAGSQYSTEAAACLLSVHLA
jgi:hypothetical protein